MTAARDIVLRLTNYLSAYLCRRCRAGGEVSGGSDIYVGGHRASDEAVAFGDGGDSAGLRFAEPSCSVTGDDIVDRVTERGGDDAAKRGDGEREPEDFEHPKDCIGTQADQGSFHQSYGAGTGFGQAGLAAEGGSRFGLTGDEAEDVFAVEAKKEIDPAVAEGAFAVEDHDRVRAIHIYIVSEERV